MLRRLPFPSAFCGVISMLRIILFVEDYGHEVFIASLIERLAREQGISVKIIRRSVRGGHGKVLTEFKIFLRYLEKAREGLPDLFIVATDANCKGYAERKKEIDKIAVEYKNFLYTLSRNLILSAGFCWIPQRSSPLSGKGVKPRTRNVQGIVIRNSCLKQCKMRV